MISLSQRRRPILAPGEEQTIFIKNIILTSWRYPTDNSTTVVSKEEKQMWNFAWCEKRAPGHSSQSKLAPIKGGEWEVGGDQLISVNQLMDILQTYTDHMLHSRKSLYTQFVNNPDSLVQFLTHKLLHIWLSLKGFSNYILKLEWIFPKMRVKEFK